MLSIEILVQKSESIGIKVAHLFDAHVLKVGSKHVQNARLAEHEVDKDARSAAQVVLRTAVDGKADDATVPDRRVALEINVCSEETRNVENANEINASLKIVFDWIRDMQFESLVDEVMPWDKVNMRTGGFRVARVKRVVRQRTQQRNHAIRLGQSGHHSDACKYSRVQEKAMERDGSSMIIETKVKGIACVA